MKCRLLLLMSLSVVLIQGLTPAQTPGEEDQYGKEIRDRQTLLDRPLETKIFFLECTQADDMQAIISTISQEARIAVAESSNALLITAPPDELETMKAAIAALDAPERSKVKSQPIMCRVYMIEMPSINQGWKSFRINLTGKTPIASSQILKNIDSTQLHIKEYSQRQVSAEKWGFNIFGQAGSCEVVENLTKIIPDSTIDQLKWEDDTIPTPIVRVSPLPDSLQKHIERFLGKGTGIAGYWFGNLSVPGRVAAPIGPWSLEFEMEPLGTEGLMGINLSVEEIRGDQTRGIIRNSMQTMIGHPVIIGYTRNKDGMPMTGALVVIPEPMPDLQ